MIIIDIATLLISLLLLGVISDRVIRYVTVVSTALGLSEMAAGFILLSVATSLPELSVSVIASFIGEGGLSVGNVLGSNIANLTIITGLAVLLSKTNVLVKEEGQKELVQFLFLSSIIPLFIVQRGSLSPVLAIVLLILFVYFGLTVSKKAPETKSLQPTPRKNVAVVGAKFLLSVTAVIIISKFTVDSGISIAEFIGLPPSVIGATIVGLGTSLPELTTTIQAIKKKLFGMALGNLLGSCITNITLILGLSSLLTFSKVNIVVTQSLMFFVLLSSLTFWYLITTRINIGRREALLLCLIYVVFVLQQIGFSIFIL